MFDDSTGQREERKIQELLIKVSWQRAETLTMADGSERMAEFRFGTTVSIDLEAKKVLTRLTTNPDGFADNYCMASQPRQRDLRQALIADWHRRGLLVTSVPFDDDSTQQPRMASMSGTYVLRNMAHMLHAAADADVLIADWMRADQREHASWMSSKFMPTMWGSAMPFSFGCRVRIRCRTASSGRS